jgi:hypothetical protein
MPLVAGARRRADAASAPAWVLEKIKPAEAGFIANLGR